MTRSTTLKFTFTALVLGLAALFFVPISWADTGDITGTLTGSHRYLRDAVVYIEHAPGHAHAPAHPIEVDQQHHQFLPHVLPVVKGTTVRFLNNDHENHNVFTPDHEGYNLGTWGFGEHRDHVFNQLGVYTQLCRLHPSMLGYVLVLQNAYFAKVAADGTFHISNVPTGHYTLKAWQERGEGSTEVTVTHGQPANVSIAMSRSHH